MKLTPDLDKLMWQVAESNDGRQVAEFEMAYPGLAPELAKRMAMVEALRGARQGWSSMSVPVFHPRVRPSPSRPIVWAIAAAGFAALTLASFFATSALLGPPSATEAAPSVAQPDISPAQQSPVHIPTAPPRTALDAPLHAPITRPNESAGALPWKPTEEPNALDHEVRNPRDEAAPTIRFRAQSAPLIAVIKAICAQSGLVAQIPEGFPNPNVSVDVTGKHGFELLQKVGSQNGFTPFHEGGNKVLFIPALDSGPLDPNVPIR